MNILYCRVSSLDQNSERQKLGGNTYNKVIEDKCSGSIPFFERPGGKMIREMIKKGSISELSVSSIDRLGRNLLDILNTIQYFTEKGISIFIANGAGANVSLQITWSIPMIKVFLSSRLND